MHDHLRTHWYAGSDGSQLSGEFPETGILYDLDHTCKTRECDGTVTRKTSPFIEHLHHHHDIELIGCSRLHDHKVGPCCFTLPADFRYFTQAELEAKYPILGRPMPDACLIERRRAPVRKTTNEIVLRKFAEATAAATDTDASTAIASASIAPTVPTAPAASTATPATPAPVAPSPPPQNASMEVDEAAFPEDYTIDIFGAEFNLNPAVITKLKGMPDVVIGYECVSFLEEEDWVAAGLTEAEYTTFTRKHDYLLVAIKAGRFVSRGYTPPPSDFLVLPTPNNLSKLGVPPALRDKLVSMGFSLDDPEGMAKLSESAWTAANISSIERRMVLRAHQSLAKSLSRFALLSRYIDS